MQNLLLFMRTLLWAKIVVQCRKGGEDPVIYDPLAEYESKFRSLHTDNTKGYFEELVQRSGVDIEENRKTVREYNQLRENLSKLEKRLGWFRFFRVLMCITILLIPLVILKMTPKIKAMRTQIQEADKKADELYAKAWRQMAPLNNLFTDRDALDLIEKTIPELSFDTCFSVKQEADMKINYDYGEHNDAEQSTLDVLAGNYNENPFLFENKVVHRMGEETYHGYRTISWTETYYSDGKLKTRTRTQTLHASVIKPKPFYDTQVVLSYCAQGGPDLSFSRDATNLDDKSERALERYVKRGERKLKKKTEQAIENNSDFMSMSNSEFEVLFDALDRTDEVQYRTLFTPLAQTNMVDLICSKTSYGDDFHFIKRRRTNKIISQHSQGRPINLLPEIYRSHSFDVIKENFIGKNTEYFKAVYFDFAPVLAIPIYQERPVHSLKPIPDYSQQYSLKECEALANAVDHRHITHPRTKTTAILKAEFVRSQGHADETSITAYSYDIEKQVDIIPVLGGDGFYHNVPVEWDDYIPLEMCKHFYISTEDAAQSGNVIASRNGLCIYQ